MSLARKIAATLMLISNSRRYVMRTKKCPVCDWEIKDGGIKVKVAGKEITVCCDDCAQKAKESPAKYVKADK